MVAVPASWTSVLRQLVRIVLIPVTEHLWRISVDQYHAMIGAGIIGENDPVELLEGILVAKLSNNTGHIFITESLRRWLEKALGPQWYIRCQEPLVTEDSQPEPDIAVVRGSFRDYRRRHPAASEAPPRSRSTGW